MRRSGFKPKHPPKPAKQMDGYTPKPREVECRISDGRARLTVAIPKRAYIRAEAMRDACRSIPCQFDDDGVVCGTHGTTWCHSNWATHGKGKSIKADDNRVASGCDGHHRELDQGKNWTEAGRKSKWWAAHVRTVRLLLATGRWPEDVPVPDIENNPFSTETQALADLTAAP